MENNKENATMKVVTNSGEKTETKKYSYEELEKICAKVVDDNKNIVAQLRRMQQTYLFQRIDFLLRIIGLSDKINDAEFINACVEEVKAVMFSDEDSETEEKKED